MPLWHSALPLGGSPLVTCPLWGPPLGLSLWGRPLSPSLWGTVGVEGGGYGAVPNPPQWLCVFPPPGYGVHVAVPERFPRGAQVGGNGGQWGWWCCGAEGFGVMGGGGGTALWGGLIPPDPTRTPKQGSDGGVPRLWGGPFALGSTIWGGGPHPLGGGGHIRGGPIRRSGGVLITWGGPYLWWGGGGPTPHLPPHTPPYTVPPQAGGDAAEGSRGDVWL